MESVVEQFFAEEADDHVKDVLRGELRSRLSGSRYFTFNVFNVRLDFDADTATVEDELNSAREEPVSLAEVSGAARPGLGRDSAGPEFTNVPEKSEVGPKHPRVAQPQLGLRTAAPRSNAVSPAPSLRRRTG